jgi:site-specific DNA recombinase
MTHPTASTSIAACYSRTAQASRRRIREQEITLDRLAQEQGFAIPDQFRFRDDGYSGLQDDRPELQRLLGMISRGTAPFSRVFVLAPDRLSRRADDSVVNFARILRAHGVDVRFATHPDQNPLERGSAWAAVISEATWASVRRTRGGVR